MSSMISTILSSKDYAVNAAWASAVHVCRNLVLGTLSSIQIGQLVITDTDANTYTLGEQTDLEHVKGPQCHLTVQNDTFWIRIALYADMGFAESYMLSEFSHAPAQPLTHFFTIVIRNRPYLATSTLTSSVRDTITTLLRRTNTLTNARLHIAAHYDISNAMFAAFLSPDMTYSCALFTPIAATSTSDRGDPPPNGAISSASSTSSISSAATLSAASPANSLPPAESLQAAQERKLQRIITAARLKRTDRVLEIGTGWGSLAIRAATQVGCRIVSLTLSAEQKKLAEERIREAGVEHLVEVRLCDYRDVLKVEGRGSFDKLVSVEMLEAVGKEYWNTYFEVIHGVLKEDGGIAVFQCITMPESKYDAYAKSDDFIRRYIFPGGHLPTVTHLVSAIHHGSKGKLIVDDIENIGPHYSKTLRLWREKFLSQFDSDIKPALLYEHGDSMNKKDIEVFRRKWEYYFTYCEAGFLTKVLGDVIITVGREGAVEMMEDVPL